MYGRDEEKSGFNSIEHFKDLCIHDTLLYMSQATKECAAFLRRAA